MIFASWRPWGQSFVMASPSRLQNDEKSVLTPWMDRMIYQGREDPNYFVHNHSVEPLLLRSRIRPFLEGPEQHVVP